MIYIGHTPVGAQDIDRHKNSAAADEPITTNKMATCSTEGAALPTLASNDPSQ